MNGLNGLVMSPCVAGSAERLDIKPVGRLVALVMVVDGLASTVNTGAGVGLFELAGPNGSVDCVFGAHSIGVLCPVCGVYFLIGLTTFCRYDNGNR